MADAVTLPGLVNGHDHLDFSTFPPLGRPPYPSVYAWADDVQGGRGNADAARALGVPLEDRLFLGALRNLLCGVTAVAHHGPRPRSPLPVRVLERFGQAHSPGLAPDLEASFRDSDGPWFVHAAEGTDEACAAEVPGLARRGLLNARTVLVHAIAADAAAVAAAGAGVVWCPESNLHLYGRTADVAALRRHGVRLGLGSDSPVSGVRDPLSTLAAARRTGRLDDAALLRLATHDTALLTGLSEAAADMVLVDDLDAFLDGHRHAVGLVVVGGRPLYGRREAMRSAGADPVDIEVDGQPRALDRQLAARARRLLPVAAPWTEGLRL